MSYIAGHNLVKDKIIYVWDVQRRGLAIKAEKERKKQLVIEAAFALLASSSLKICYTYWFSDDYNLLVSMLIQLIGLAKAAAVFVLSQRS